MEETGEGAFSDWLSGFRNAKWNGKLDEKVKEWIGRFFTLLSAQEKEVEEEASGSRAQTD